MWHAHSGDLLNSSRRTGSGNTASMLLASAAAAEHEVSSNNIGSNSSARYDGIPAVKPMSATKLTGNVVQMSSPSLNTTGNTAGSGDSEETDDEEIRLAQV